MGRSLYLAYSDKDTATATTATTTTTTTTAAITTTAITTTTTVTSVSTVLRQTRSLICGRVRTERTDNILT
jgi:hypothetical protein